MTNIFTLDNFEDFSERINMDELYEKKQQNDLEQLELYNKILNRVHVKIKTTSRQIKNEQSCWFVVPEMIIGVPRYDQGSCIAFLLDKLQTNGFSVRYIHPNVLFICWKFYVPSYVREQLKKKRGIEVDEFGKKKEIDPKEDEYHPLNSLGKSTATMSVSGEKSGRSQLGSGKKEYNSTKSYKPTGKLIYNEEMLDMIDLNLK
jgi:hypothetical protein